MGHRVDEEMWEQRYKEYNKGFSLAEIGRMFGVTRQSIYDGFHRRKLKLREKKRLPYQFFNGEKFTLRNTGYYGRTKGNRTLMHIVVWKYHNGNIPKEHDLHHKNHDKTDNRIDNLELYSKSEHASKFNTGANGYGKNRRKA